MSSLTIKQRAKVNAALCIIHDKGLDANAVTTLARTIMATGHDPRTAYERAINQFANDNPAVGPAISKITRLVEASCPRTVAQYDLALTSYIETGDDTALVALAPTIAEDGIALAVRNGEITAEEAASGDLSKALGIEAGTTATPSNEGSEPAKFEFNGLSDRAPEAKDTTSSAMSLAGDGPGMVAPKAQRAWADTPYVGPTSVTPALNGLTPNAAREAAKASVLNGSRAIIDAPAEGAAR